MNHSTVLIRIISVISNIIFLTGGALLATKAIKVHDFGWFIVAYTGVNLVVLFVQWISMMWNNEPKIVEPKIQVNKFILTDVGETDSKEIEVLELQVTE